MRIRQQYQTRMHLVIRPVLSALVVLCAACMIYVICFIHWQQQRMALQLQPVAERIADFVIAQDLIGNQEAIEVFVNAYNRKQIHNKLFVFSRPLSLSKAHFKSRLPYRWLYIYPLQYKQQRFGHLIISGSYLSDALVRTHIYHATVTIALCVLLVLIGFLLFKRYRVVGSRQLPDEVDVLREKVNLLFSETQEISRKVSWFDVAKQVAHDIRSPLAAMNTVINRLDDIEESKRLMIRNASRRLNDIANNLLTTAEQAKATPVSNQAQSELLFVALDSIVSEKRFEYSHLPIEFNFEIADDAYATFAYVEQTTLKRVFSNLINNAVEAIVDQGVVNVGLTYSDDYALITIKDTGQGMSEEVLSKIARKGFSYGKSQGAGLGFSYAKEQIERMQGHIQLSSQVGAGTQVMIYLRRSLPPRWFCQRVYIHDAMHVVVLDDDSSIHDVWRDKLLHHCQITLRDVFNAQELITLIQKQGLAQLYLIDYELFDKRYHGLALIEQLGLQDCAVLVTSSFEEPSLRQRCEAMNITMLPKSYVPYVPVIVQAVCQQVDAVLIDDDELIGECWQVAAEQAGIKLHVFTSADAFYQVHHDYTRQLTIYIDSSLGDGIKGEVYARKFYLEGFSEIYVVTGYPASSIEHAPWLKGVLDKQPPFVKV